MKRLLIAAGALLAGGGVVTGAGAFDTLHAVALPAPTAPLSGKPPFPPTSRFTVANVFRPPILSNERVAVGVDESGRVTSIRVLQRLRLPVLGDYLLSIPGPIVDVDPAPGTQSQPGLRRGTVVWQGFSAGGKTLAAWARLDPARAQGPLPLRVAVARAGGEVRVTIRNTTPVKVRTATGAGDALELARILDQVRRHPSGVTLGQSVFANVSGRVVRRPISVEAPLRVTGTITVGGVRRPIDRVLGGGRPLEVVVRVAGSGRARLALLANPYVPADVLRPPVGRSWVGAVRKAPRVLTGRRVLDLTWRVLAQVARVRQYRSYLANPDPNGSVRAVYSFRTLATAAPLPRPSSESSSGLGPVAIALIAAATFVAAGGLVVLWAHS